MPLQPMFVGNLLSKISEVDVFQAVEREMFQCGGFWTIECVDVQVFAVAVPNEVAVAEGE